MSTFDYLLEGFWTEHGDPRTTGYLLMDSLRPLLTILLLYSFFVLYLGPRLMATQPAYSLKPLLMVYNCLMSLWNAYFFYHFMVLTNFGLDSLNVAFPSLEDTSPIVILKMSLEHQYLFSKLVDLLDTVFFILRKKTAQVTWLHVYHHASTPLVCWFHFRQCAVHPIAIPFAVLNTFIHMLMYAYYGLSALGPRMQPYLWWKRYLTAIQILQFVILFVYGIYFSLFQSGFHSFFMYHTIIQSSIYLLLFGQFYRKTYSKKRAIKNE